jgi:hypothetical protein
MTSKKIPRPHRLLTFDLEFDDPEDAPSGRDIQVVAPRRHDRPVRLVARQRGEM